MKCTVEMPDGLKVKIQSERRYVVVNYSSAVDRWVIEKRSDNEQTALAMWREYGRRGRTTHLIDTATKQVTK